MNIDIPAWDEIKQLADQVELEVKLGTMEARDHWRALRPRIDRLEKSIEKAGAAAAETVKRELDEVRGALRALRGEIAH